MIRGDKPLYHDEYGPEAAIRIARGLRVALIPDVEIHAVEGHLYVYQRDAVQAVIRADPDWYFGETLLDRIHDATITGANGHLLGYGLRMLTNRPRVLVSVVETASRRRVFAFYSSPDQADEYGRLRASDWTLFTGRAHSWEIGPVDASRL